MAKIITNEFLAGPERRHYTTVDWTPPPKGMALNGQRVLAASRWDEEKGRLVGLNPDGPFQDGDILYTEPDKMLVEHLLKDTLEENDNGQSTMELDSDNSRGHGLYLSGP